MHKILRRIFPVKPVTGFFSQDGEDLLLQKMLEGKKKGFYVDVGAAHPIRASNTYRLYQQGWRGICVDASPGLAPLFRRHRPRDIFLDAYVGNQPGSRDFYVFDEPFLNTGSRERADFLRAETKYQFQGKATLTEASLREILGQHLPAGTSIDLMSVDVEEGELEVLESNDWSKFRPLLIVMEVLESDREKIGKHRPVQFLKNLGYRPTAILPRSVFFSAA